MKWHESESNAQDKRGIFFSINLQNVPTKVLYFKKIDLHTSRIKKEMWKTRI